VARSRQNPSLHHKPWQHAIRASWGAFAAGVFFLVVNEGLWAWVAFAVGGSLAALGGVLLWLEERGRDR
jgi:hypothetical protein